MKYCRIAIDTDARGRVYQRDFDAQHVFGPLARAQASLAVSQELVAEGAPYRVVVFPRYGDTLVNAALVQKSEARASEPRAGWLDLDFDGPVAPDQPLRFFTIELRFPDSGVVFSRDFQMTGLETFWQNLQSVMLHNNILAEGDRYYPRIYARDDEAADFDHEEVRLLPADDGALLVELVDVEPSAPEFPSAALEDFAVRRVEELAVVSPVELAALDTARQDGVQVVITEPTLRALQGMAVQDVQVEQGGMLVGTIYRQAANPEGYIITITDHIAAEGTTASLVEMRYTFESWQRSAVLLRERFPGKQIVGWYHTHLVSIELAGDDGQAQATEMFFSEDDRFTHRRFFGDPWYVAMVLGPEGNAAFFRWFGDKISANRRYYVMAETAAPHED